MGPVVQITERREFWEKLMAAVKAEMEANHYYRPFREAYEEHDTVVDQKPARGQMVYDGTEVVLWVARRGYLQHLPALAAVVLPPRTNDPQARCWSTHAVPLRSPRRRRTGRKWTLERIDWKTSAIVLEKLIRYEAVHQIQGWDDLRRRIDPPDRRCYAFFHPALIDEPLIFVEVALIGAYCPFCITSQIVMTIIFILTVIRVSKQP